ncbi:MAG: uroporphyrinogen decarboxylase, partial [Planctomycetota bacterium]|nr:uroporphyrinogen decarboxylase [Planctomycetota bacterium]
MSDLFLRALRCEPVERLPVWMMRQAGRYLPEYRATKEKAGGFLSLCKTPELAVEVTLQPVDRLGVDAAILFSDIMVPLLPAVPGLDFAPGPTLPGPVTSPEGLAPAEVVAEVDFVYETIRLLRRELKVPLIGFAGTPATVATYLVEGGSAKHFTAFRKLLHAEPARAHALLDWLEELMLRYLTLQVDAGAQAVQLFDSWGGELSARDFETFCAPGLRRIVAALKERVPVIFFGRGALRDVGQTCTGVDWTQDLAAARANGPVQGNLDPARLFGTPESVRAAVAEMVAPVK